MGNEMNHLDEGTIHAWLDEALPPDESARVEAHVRACASCASAVAEARGLIAASSRILSALDAVPGDVLPGVPRDRDQLAAIRRRAAAAPRRHWWRDRQFLAAASLVLIAGTATAAWRVWNRVNAIPAPATQEPAAGRAPAQPPAVNPPVPTPGSAAGATAERERSARPEEPREATLGAAARSPRTSASDRVTEADVLPQAKKAEAPMVAGADSSVRPAGNLAGSAAAAEAKSAQSERPRRDAPIPAPAAAGGLNELRARQSGQVNLVDQTARSAGLRTAELPATPVSAAHAGCYALRAPGPANTRLLGVPELVRLLEDPYPPDSTWRRGIPLEPASVPTSIIWRSLDSTTVEVHVRRPVDSTVVWFKAVLEGSPLGAVVRPPGTLIARADRVLCR